MCFLCRFVENQNLLHQFTFRGNTYKLPYSSAIECCEQAFTRCLLLPLTTAHDMNILNNCPVGHIPLGKLHVKMAFTDWILCLFYCLWTIMQFDIHQITNNYITNINLPIILVI